MKPIKAVFINAQTGTVRDVTVASLEDMQRFVGGLIEVATQGPAGVLYVDEEGLLKDTRYGFKLTGSKLDTPRYVGNGLIVGPTDAEGEDTDATINAARLRHMVRYYKR